MLLTDIARELLSDFAGKKDNGPVDKLNYHIFKNICDAFDGTRRNCWTSSIAPFEFIPIFDMMNLPIELIISNLARFGRATELIDLGSETMESREICTCMRGCTGGIATNQYPRPDALMRSSHFCVGADKLFDMAEEKYGVPYYLVNVPLNDVPDAVDYVARQFEDIFKKLEDHLAANITQSKIDTVFDNINQTYSNFRRIAELMMTRP
ncbi:MAG: 2-hydroxyacyl-CoA dehydratase, partial [bacterium]